MVFVNVRSSILPARLGGLDWVGPEAAPLLRAKIDATTELFGYPDLVLNSTALDQLYSRFYVSEREFFMNQVCT